MQPGGKRRALIPPAEGYVTDGLEPQVCVSVLRALAEGHTAHTPDGVISGSRLPMSAHTWFVTACCQSMGNLVARATAHCLVSATLSDSRTFAQVPTYAGQRQVLNHKSEGLLFEVQLVRIRR